jgi:hypothetical protein
MDKIALSTNLINAVLAYLGKRPYEETYQLIDALQKEGKEFLEQQAAQSTQE